MNEQEYIAEVDPQTDRKMWKKKEECPYVAYKLEHKEERELNWEL